MRSFFVAQLHGVVVGAKLEWNELSWNIKSLESLRANAFIRYHRLLVRWVKWARQQQWQWSWSWDGPFGEDKRFLVLFRPPSPWFPPKAITRAYWFQENISAQTEPIKSLILSDERYRGAPNEGCCHSHHKRWQCAVADQRGRTRTHKQYDS